MKIRTDFVTNSSSSSFVTIRAKSGALAEFLKEKMDEIEENNYGYCDVEITIDGDEVLIESGDRDARFETPSCLDNVIYILLVICHLESYDDDDDYDDEVDTMLTESLEKIEWSYEVIGLDGDDGRWDRKNYDPKVLEELLEEIAECNDCEPEDVTDEMFNDYVSPEPDDTTEEATFSYDKATGKCKYIYRNIMNNEEKDCGECGRCFRGGMK